MKDADVGTNAGPPASDTHPSVGASLLERLRTHGNHNGLPGRLLGFGAALLLAGGTLFLSGVRL